MHGFGWKVSYSRPEILFELFIYSRHFLFPIYFPLCFLKVPRDWLKVYQVIFWTFEPCSPIPKFYILKISVLVGHFCSKFVDTFQQLHVSKCFVVELFRKPELPKNLESDVSFNINPVSTGSSCISERLKSEKHKHWLADWVASSWLNIFEELLPYPKLLE